MAELVPDSADPPAPAPMQSSEAPGNVGGKNAALQGPDRDSVNSAADAGIVPSGAKKSKKRSKKKKMKKVDGSDTGVGDAAVAAATAAAEREQNLRRLAGAMSGMSLKAIKEATDPNGATVLENERQTDKIHKFWDTQPVPKINEKNETGSAGSGLVDVVKTVSDVRSEPYNLPAGFHWVSVDVDNDREIEEVYLLLTENYVEDDDNMFRFDYSVKFLRWALKAPGYTSDWHIGVRADKSKKLLAFITGIPATVHIYGQTMKMAEINFLCVHKKLRSKRLAPVLIKEVTRRVNLKNVWQAVYTAGVVLPKPVARCRYWHRSLNPKKLIDVGFSRIGPRMTMTRTLRLYKLPEEPEIPGIIPMQERHTKGVCKLLRNHLSRFDLWIEFDEHEVSHWLLPREGVINTYVIEGEQPGEVTDLCSFYHLPSSIIGHDTYKTLYAAYSYYNVATTVSLEKLMSDVLVLARRENFDVFNCLDVQDNECFLKKLKFGIGDGHLQYYLYNWRCKDMNPQRVGIVLL